MEKVYYEYRSLSTFPSWESVSAHTRTRFYLVLAKVGKCWKAREGVVGGHHSGETLASPLL